MRSTGKQSLLPRGWKLDTVIKQPLRFIDLRKDKGFGAEMEYVEMLPSFETERLLLRPRTTADFDACLTMNEDPEVIKFIPGPWNDPELHGALLKQRILTFYGHGLGYWSIFLKKDPETLLGWVLLKPENGGNPDIEISWRLKREAWGEGYATEAALAVLDYAFGTLALNRVIADINPYNAASIRVADKLGMKVLQAGRMVATAAAAGAA